jgi:hypothetical protein
VVERGAALVDRQAVLAVRQDPVGPVRGDRHAGGGVGRGSPGSVDEGQAPFGATGVHAGAAQQDVVPAPAAVELPRGLEQLEELVHDVVVDRIRDDADHGR